MENKDFAERNVGLVRALVPRFLGRGIEYEGRKYAVWFMEDGVQDRKSVV